MRGARLVALGGMVVMGLTLAGCGSPSATDNPASTAGTPATSTSSTSSAPPAEARTSRATPPPGPSSSSTAGSSTMPQGKELASQVAGATAVDAGRYKGPVTPVGFTTPSGNLTCGLCAGADAMVTCQIESFTFTSPAGDCNGGGSGSAIVYTPPAQPVFACSGDVESVGPVLQYGSKLSVKGLTCVSRAVGVICVDDRAHGFLLARARYSVQ